MDPKRLIAAMAERLYDDIKFVTQQNPVQIVDDDGARAYNNLLARVRKEFHFVDVISDFTEWSPRTIKYKDALVVAGQLCAVLQVLIDRQPINQRAAVSAPTQLASTTGVPRPGGPPPANLLSPPTQAPPPLRKPPPPNISSATSVAIPPPGALGAGPAPSPNATPAPAAAPVAAPPQAQHREDPDLYGANQPPRRNEDGTIPFSLD